MFSNIIEDSVSTTDFLIIIAIGIALGFLVAFVSKYKSDSSKSFLITTSILPLSISVIIMMVNGSIGAGIAVAGAFSLVRFRSEPGTAREISIILIDMTIGIMLGMGYIIASIVFTIIALLILFLLSNTSIFDSKNNKGLLTLKVTVPESLDFENEFKEIFDKYLVQYELIKAKTSLMGSLFDLTYDITLKNVNNQKSFIDDIRTKNSNLEVLIEKHNSKEKEL